MADVRWVPVGTVTSTPESGQNDSALVLFDGATGYVIRAGDVQLVGNVFSAVQPNADLVFQPSGTGLVAVTSSLQTAKDLILLDDDGNESISIEAPSSLVESYRLILPPNDGDPGNVLTTDGFGILTWVDIMSGNVIGPATSTSNAIARWNGTSGTAIQDSGVIIDDSNNMTGAVSSITGNISISGNTITTVNTNGDLLFAANGTGVIVAQRPILTKISVAFEDPGVGSNNVVLIAPTPLAASYTLTLPVDDGTSGQILTTDGSGVLSWTTGSGGTVTGPVSSTDSAIVRWNGASGIIIENSGVTLDGSNNMTGIGNLSNSGYIQTKTSLILIDPGVGANTITIQSPTLSGNYTLTLPVDDGTTGQVLSTDGSGVLSWVSTATGDVHGPSSATDNALVRFDTTTGKLIQNSV